MTDPTDASTTKRRAALKKLLGISGAAAVSQALPEQWIKPVVDAVVLPAHAQTSQQLDFFGPVPPGMGAVDAPGDGLLETLVPAAHASFVGSVCLSILGSSYTARVADGGLVWTGAGTVGGGDATLNGAPGCTAKSRQINVSSFNLDFAFVSLDGGTVTPIPRGACTLPTGCA